MYEHFRTYLCVMTWDLRLIVLLIRIKQEGGFNSPPHFGGIGGSNSRSLQPTGHSHHGRVVLYTMKGYFNSRMKIIKTKYFNTCVKNI